MSCWGTAHGQWEIHFKKYTKRGKKRKRNPTVLLVRFERNRWFKRFLIIAVVITRERALLSLQCNVQESSRNKNFFFPPPHRVTLASFFLPLFDYNQPYTNGPITRSIHSECAVVPQSSHGLPHLQEIIKGVQPTVPALSWNKYDAISSLSLGLLYNLPRSLNNS